MSNLIQSVDKHLQKMIDGQDPTEPDFDEMVKVVRTDVRLQVLTGSVLFATHLLRVINLAEDQRKSQGETVLDSAYFARTKLIQWFSELLHMEVNQIEHEIQAIDAAIDAMEGGEQ